jgi:protein SCO1/2
VLHNLKSDAIKLEMTIRRAFRALGCGLSAMLFLTACHKQSGPLPESGPASAADRRTFVVNGVVKVVEPDGKTVVIQHEAITNYMAAMTMPFEVRDARELRGLQPGDAISFHLVVTPKEGWIDGITRRLDFTPDPAGRPTVYLTRGDEPLEEGDMLPDFHFTNELGQAVSLSQYKGRVLAFTFFFTACPFPNFCPRMTGNFAEAAAQLNHLPGAPVRWHLLSISFDPQNDTPQRLLNYAKGAHYDPSHWSFLTGEMVQIIELADLFGEHFSTENGSISHNLRTVVVDARGRVRKIYRSNDWTSGELVQEMVKANRD